MAFFRQYISPLIILLIFLISLAAVSIRIFLPSDMAAPAPVDISRVAADHLAVVPLATFTGRGR